MVKVTVKAYAKINIALNVCGSDGEYHNLDTFVTTVNKYDLITVTRRKDDKILVSFVGPYGFTPKFQEQTNAYKTAKMFMDCFKCVGVNIEVVRNIPTGSGMGGSSADVAGVLKAMKKLFNVTDSVFPLADKLGSDSTYLLKGGYARLLKRGEEVIPINCNKTLYFVVIYANAGVETKLCFNEFDRLNKSGIACDIKEVINAVRNGDFSVFKDKNNNALYDSARNLNGEIEENLNALKNLSPNYCGMTGSGSTVFCMYEELEMAKWACDKLKKQNKNAELLTTFNPLKPTLIDIILKRDYAFKE